MSLELHDDLFLLKRRYIGSHIGLVTIEKGYKYSLEEQGRTNILYSMKVRYLIRVGEMTLNGMLASLNQLDVLNTNE